MTDTQHRRARVAATISIIVLIVGMFVVLFIGAPPTHTCYTPCDCTTSVDRPCTPPNGRAPTP